MVELRMKMELGLPSYQAGGQQYPAGAPNGIPAIPFPAEDFMENPPVLKSNKMRPSNKISDSAGRNQLDVEPFGRIKLGSVLVNGEVVFIQKPQLHSGKLT